MGKIVYLVYWSHFDSTHYVKYSLWERNCSTPEMIVWLQYIQPTRQSALVCHCRYGLLSGHPDTRSRGSDELITLQVCSSTWGRRTIHLFATPSPRKKSTIISSLVTRPRPPYQVRESGGGGGIGADKTITAIKLTSNNKYYTTGSRK